MKNKKEEVKLVACLATLLVAISLLMYAKHEEIQKRREVARHLDCQQAIELVDIDIDDVACRQELAEMLDLDRMAMIEEDIRQRRARAGHVLIDLDEPVCGDSRFETLEVYAPTCQQVKEKGARPAPLKGPPASSP